MFYIDQHVENTLYFGVSLTRPGLGTLPLNSREAQLLGNLPEVNFKALSDFPVIDQLLNLREQEFIAESSGVSVYCSLRKARQKISFRNVRKVVDAVPLIAAQAKPIGSSSSFISSFRRGTRWGVRAGAGVSLPSRGL